MTAPAVTFDYATWIARYPEFGNVSSPLATMYFAEAGLYCANDTCNPAFAAGILPTLLNMLTAHVAALNAPVDASGNAASAGAPNPSLVGRIASAAEGSVNVGVELDGAPGSPSEAWFSQTKYGFAFWQATAQFRNAVYVANPTVIVNGAFPSGPLRGGPFF